ncbi:MAG: PD-(D/E)XK nuclease family protein [Bergeyella sp.]
MKFLEKSISHILENHPDLSEITIVTPGKRPMVFIKKILKEKEYSGFLPRFVTIQEIITEISELQEINGVALWLFAYDVYRKTYPSEDFAQFLKWFPTVQKDWDDMLKFAESDTAVLQYMLDEERIRNWSEKLGEETSALKKNLNFWKKMNQFLPALRKELENSNLATSGMIHEKTKGGIENFVQKTDRKYAFLGFNALTPVEEKLIRSLLQFDKALCCFHSDSYYMEDERQEAGKFLREYKTWKEFNESRGFRWTEKDFEQPKNIKVYEVSGNISQTKILPEILSETKSHSDTAVVLLDENLLPASLDALSSAGALNITMGFPLKNLSFSNAVKQVFYLQKQLHKKDSSYYYNDILPILEEMPLNEKDKNLIEKFLREIEEFNIIYISKQKLEDGLRELSFFPLLKKQDSRELLEFFTKFCTELKFREDIEKDDILYENISHFEKIFRVIINQISPYDFSIDTETLEVLISQLVNSETIDFEGEPLQGIQVMGLLETRLLNFENVIMLSVNEGKLPLGNSQNTYLPFDVRKIFNLNTFIENDSIYAYHFYRLIQNSQHIHLLYNALSSGVNTGEKSRFITQMEMESPHTVEHIIIENNSEPMEPQTMVIEKTPTVMEKLEAWKHRVSVSHLINYLYNPVDFYFSKVLGTSEADEMEEELSVRNYGNLIHYALDYLYSNLKGKILIESDLRNLITKKDEAISEAIIKLKHQPEFYEKGMNFVHKSIAFKILGDILDYDLQLIQNGNTLEIIDLERKFEGIDFYLDDEQSRKVSLYGFIDRIDKLNGTVRIIDYKTAKTSNLKVKIDEDKIEDYLCHNHRKQALQLCMYQYVLNHLPEFAAENIATGIWSFAEVNRGVATLEFDKCSLDDALVSVRNLISEILNPEIPFAETVSL